MEVVLLASCLNTLLPKLWDKRKEDKNRSTAIDINIRAILRESTRLYAALEDAKFKGDGTGISDLKRQARELSQEARDCIQLFFKNGKASCTEFATKTQDYSERIQILCDQLEKHSSSRETAPKKPQDPLVTDPIGMDGPRDELLELVDLPGGPSEGKRKVISIVGFPGLGKTVLAKLVYDHDRTSSLPHRARVTAAAKDADEVLREVLKQVDSQGKHDNLNLEDLAQLLAKLLRGKRYLIVIDDIQSIKQWGLMNDAFPKDGDGDGEGTIIVTTTIQSVANVCSSCNGYVYKLSPLDKDKSLDLFLRDATWWNRYLVENYAQNILKICDGLPLAIVSMSQILQGKGARGASDAFEYACAQLDTCLVQQGPNLERLRWVLMNKYTCLAGDPLRCCLLYFCMYKHNMDAVPRKNSMIRRWEAEGFLEAKNRVHHPRDVGARNLETLIDLNIIQSMEVGITGSTRRCRPPGMMVEYISRASMSESFAASVSDAEAPGMIRRLSFCDGGSAEDDLKISGMDLSKVLTLAVSGKGCQFILNFTKYELLAVLDLKECSANLNKKDVQYICQLLLLKYLSLGKSIGSIPRDIGQLELLETLEMRTTETVNVYSEVLQLPNLKHLLGKFQLDETPTKSLYDFLEEKSCLLSCRCFAIFVMRACASKQQAG